MNRKDMIPLLGTFVCWGSLYVVSKIALRTIPPVTVLLLRYLVAMPALFLLLKLRGALKPVKREHVGTLFAIGLLGYCLSFCLQMLGINRLSGSISSLLGAMNPIFIPILAAIFLREKLTKEKVMCVLVSMVGVVLIVGVDGKVDVMGAALMLMSVFLWSTTSIIIRRLAGQYDPMQVAMMAMLFATPFTGAWAVFELQSSACTLPLSSILAVIYMGLVGTAMAHSLWNYSLSKMDASFCSMFYPLQPLVSGVLGVLILHEQITPNFLVGGAIVCCGIVAAVRTGKK
ncbi:MAG: DMT family transporter [Christensenellales bacterium]|nr:DMT family transporter [Christensenellales bacterium]